MTLRAIGVLLLASAFAASAFASSPKHHKDSSALTKAMRHDPAFRTGYDDGYRVGANDCESLSLAYRDESGPTFDQATDGYAPQYGDKDKYQKLFRLGYVAGYKAGWDFNAGRYTSFGAGGDGP